MSSAKDIAEELASFPVYSMTDIIDPGDKVRFAKKAKKLSQAYLDLLAKNERLHEVIRMIHCTQKDDTNAILALCLELEG